LHSFVILTTIRIYFIVGQSPFENPTFTFSVKNPFHHLLKATEAFDVSLLCAQVSEKQVKFRGIFNLHVWAQCLNSSSDFIHYYRQAHSHHPH